MTKPILRLVARALFMLCVWATKTTEASSPFFQVTELGLPEGVEVRAMALNQSNRVAGWVLNEDGTSTAFMWSDGEFKLLPAFEGVSEAFGLNNKGQIVGRARLNGKWTAWQHENGSDVVLDESNLASEATGINDDGLVIGNVGNDAYVLRPRKIEITCCRANGTPEGTVAAVNNSGVILGSEGGSGFLLQDFEKPGSRQTLRTLQEEPGSVKNFGIGNSLNSAGDVAGDFKYALSVRQAGIWRNATWNALGIPLNEDSAALSINDHGGAVGWAGADKRPFFWLGETGIELKGIVSFEGSGRIVSAKVINNNNVILAEREEEGRVLPVLLHPLEENLSLPAFSFGRPVTGAVNPDSEIDVELNRPLGINLKKVTYVLLRRNRHWEGVEMWTWTVYSSVLVETNSVSSEPFNGRFHNLPPGQYALAAELETEAHRLYIPPVFFAVGSQPKLKAYRLNFAGEFEYGFSGSPGLAYDIEGSTDLKSWTVLQRETEGGVFSKRVIGTNLIFIRAKPAAQSPVYFGISPSIIENGPATLRNLPARFFYGKNGRIELMLNENIFKGTTVGFEVEGFYSYSINGLLGRFRAVDEREPIWILDVEIEFPLFMLSCPGCPLAIGANFRGYEQIGTVKSSISGKFTTSP